MSILGTKLHIPHTRNELLIERPLLIKSLNEGLKAKLTVLTAPAGYGKTTALVEWVQQCGCPAVWVSLDRHDNDLVQFWSYVLAAVERVYSNLSGKLASHLDGLISGVFGPFLVELQNGFAHISDDMVLILDDFHLIELASIHTSLEYLLEHLPSNIHLYIASRSELPFPVARLRAKGELKKIAVQNLKFRLDEGARYLHNCMGLLLSEEEIFELVRCTEGWISGLHLAALSVKSSEDPSMIIKEFSGRHRDISTYLLEELFEQQPEEIQSFLLTTSILNRMNHSLCETVTGLGNGQERLDRMERLQLFVIPLDERREWYRYHHLFADFLQQQLRHKFPERWAEVHANAARWLKENGLMEEAVEHYLAGHHYDEAASLIERSLFDLRLKRTLLLRWVNMLPEAHLEMMPGIQCFNIKILADTGELDLAEAKLLALQNKLTDPMWQPWADSLLLITSEIAMYYKDIKRASECLEEFERRAPNGSYLQMISGNTLQDTDYETLLAFIEDLHEGANYFLRWIKVWEQKKHYPFVGYFYRAYGEVMYEWNRLEEAEIYVERVLKQKQMEPYGRILVQASITAARISHAKGNTIRAFELLEQVKLRINSPDKQAFMMMLDSEKASLSLMEGFTNNTIAWMHACGLKSTDSIPMNQISMYIHLSKALAANGQGSEALGLLDRLYRLVDGERLHDKIRVLIVQSVVLYKQGDTPASLLKLEAALLLAEPQGYLRSFIDEGAVIAKLLSQYLHMRQHSFIRNSTTVSLIYIKRLLQMVNIHADDTMMPMVLLTEQETRILKMVEQGWVNKQMAELLNVKPNTIKMHMKNIYKKLDVNSRLQVLQRARELKVL
ncbi:MULTISPECIES: LuxR C-terminal-related transcriptional regulator [unclassified Paenibacillus]|uniref:LuxR C-terminal-related transcriptional regulator n=1 Tax=unclassified Paenibacillus TaxID=185978 RepID=UPI003629E0B8